MSETDTDFDRDLELQLIKHEDLRLKPYRCSADKLSIGVGRNLDDNGITRIEAMVMLRNDITSTRFALEKAVPGFLGFSAQRRRALIDMCFNLGLTRFLQFKQMLAAIRMGDFCGAADEMLNSKWASQVGKEPGQRAHTLATMMREG